MFIDTHTHIYLEDFSKDRYQIIQECVKAKVDKLLLPNIDSSTIEDVINISKDYENFCFPMVGLHPCSVSHGFNKELTILKAYIDKYKPIAIGEIGIDLYWDKSTYEFQKNAFIEQINWAVEFNLPIVIHARESYKEIFQILDSLNYDTLKGVLDYGGFKLGIGGLVTFKNSGLDKVLKEIKIENLVLETDSPYLTPDPFRGKRNKSSYIPLIANKLSDIYEISIEEIGKITSLNAAKIFNI